MIVYAQLDVNDITTYHTESHLNDSDQKVTRIRSTEEYKKVRASIIREGQIDPVIAMCTPRRKCMVEVGEQRVLIAREIGIPYLNALVYNIMVREVPIKYEYKLKDIDDFINFSECKGIQMLRKYIHAKIAYF